MAAVVPGKAGRAYPTFPEAVVHPLVPRGPRRAVGAGPVVRVGAGLRGVIFEVQRGLLAPAPFGDAPHAKDAQPHGQRGGVVVRRGRVAVGGALPRGRPPKRRRVIGGARFADAAVAVHAAAKQDDAADGLEVAMPVLPL